MTFPDPSPEVALTMTHLDNSSDPVSQAQLTALLAELDEADDEEHEVSVEDPHGWGIVAFADGTLVLSHALDLRTELELREVSRDDMLAIMSAFVRLDMDEVWRAPWKPA